MEPVRTCIGCRSRAPRTELLRLVHHEGHLEIDEKATLPGRGAWIHPRIECVENATRRNAYSRALRFAGRFDATDLQNRLNGNGHKMSSSK